MIAARATPLMRGLKSDLARELIKHLAFLMIGGEEDRTARLRHTPPRPVNRPRPRCIRHFGVWTSPLASATDRVMIVGRDVGWRRAAWR